MNADEIRKLFKDHEVPLYASDVWQVQSSYVIKHSALERLAAGLEIQWHEPEILRSERDEAVILVTGRRGEISEWSIGEALVNANYRVSGKQAPYVYAMAEKRAKDRVILKLAQLYGAYSEDEADDFKQPQAPQEAIKAPPAPPERNVVPLEPPPVKRGPGRPPKQVMPPPTPLPPELEELFEWEDPETGELRHVTEAELEQLERLAARVPEPAGLPAPDLTQAQREMPGNVAKGVVTEEQKKANAALTANPLKIPDFLRREKPAAATAPNGPPWPDPMRDPDNWLKRFDTELARLNDGDAMQEIWDKHVEPVAGDLFPPDLEEAQNIMRHHTRKVEP